MGSKMRGGGLKNANIRYWFFSFSSSFSLSLSPYSYMKVKVLEELGSLFFIF